MALIKGICKNFGECDLADNKEIQEAEKANFVCEECGKPLHPIGKNSESASSGKGGKKLIIATVAGLLAIGLIGGIVYTFEASEKVMLSLNHYEKELSVGDADTLVATITPKGTETTLLWKASKSGTLEVANGIVKAVKAGEGKVRLQAIIGADTLQAICKYTVNAKEDSVKIGETVKAYEPKGEVQEKPKKEQTKNSKNGTKGLSYGIYKGDLRNDIPNGFGDVEFTHRKLITGDIYAEPGYKIRNARFENGKLKSGTLYDADGNKISFIDANNNL
ncbi:MAG: hypothetical protein J6I31_00895 [Prevotella sp.]|nr:hypothetical protein [Prevotella sp.]